MQLFRWTIWILLFLPLVGHSQRTFQKKTYYDAEQTKLKEVVTMLRKDSTLHGTYASLYVNGSLAIKGHYSQGKSDSTWIYYYENGHEKAYGPFDTDNQSGKWKYFYESGELKAVGTYANNIKHGSWTYYYENGQEKSTGIYFKNQKEGIWNYFYEDGSLKAQAFFQQGKGHYKEFYPNGKLKTEGRNEYEKSEGPWTYYYESDGIEAEGNFKRGLRNGFWKYYHENGQLAAEGVFKDGEKSGVWKYYFPDGTISSEGEMVNDQRDGFWKLYYQSGEIKGEGKYDQGSGDYVEYYPNGKQKARGAMENGMREGRWEYYNEEGLEDGEAVFVDGVGDYKGYYPDGTIKMTGTIDNGKRVGQWTLYNPDGTVAGIYKPVYEEERPIFRTTNFDDKKSTKQSSDKVEYMYKNRKIRYFNPRINEYTGIIVATNPLQPLFNQLPISVEYYIQERLGYEINIVMRKKPFYQDISSKSSNQVNSLGFDLHLRQKFYHDDTKLGMFYFGHEILTGYLEHQATVMDSSQSPAAFTKIFAKESRLAYGLFIGDRWMKRTGNSGLTIDFNLGIALGRRFFKKAFDQQYSNVFDELNQDKFYLPLIFTLNIGFAGPKRKTTSF